MELLNSDYKKILVFYNQPIPKSERMLKKYAEKVLADKLCTCIKKVSPFGKESRAIGICTKSVLNRKNIRRGKFTCKTNRKIDNLIKTKKNLSVKRSKISKL